MIGVIVPIDSGVIVHHVSGVITTPPVPGCPVSKPVIRSIQTSSHWKLSPGSYLIEENQVPSRKTFSLLAIEKTKLQEFKNLDCKDTYYKC